jgi:hypothetical protein
MKLWYHFTYTSGLILVMLIFLLASVSSCSVPAELAESDNQQSSASASVAWLYRESQNDDGGFGTDFATGDPMSNIPNSLDAVLAVAALGYSPTVPAVGAEKSVIDYLNANTADMVDFAAIDGGSNGKVILALLAAKEDARDFAGHDYVAQLSEQLNRATGSYGNTTAFNQGLAIAALTAVGEAVPPIALEWLEASQADDGSWEDGFGTAQNPDATAMAVMGLLAGGRELSDASVADALNFLRDSQLDSGGWEYGAGFGENANSTALVVQALAAAGENYSDASGKWAVNGTSPLQALLSWQNTTGAFQADFGQGKTDDFFATAQAVPAVLGKPFPFDTSLQMKPFELEE